MCVCCVECVEVEEERRVWDSLCSLSKTSNSVSEATSHADGQRECLSGGSDVCDLQEMMLLVAGNALRDVEHISYAAQITRGFHRDKPWIDA